MSADRCSASLSLSLAAPGGDDPEAKDATEKVAATFKRAMEEMDAELVPLCARVFYKCGHSLAKQIVGGMSPSSHSRHYAQIKYLHPSRSCCSVKGNTSEIHCSRELSFTSLY